jgi:hypothetical protein
MSARTPVLSVVVVVYAMPDQAKRTLFTLSPAYQRNVDAADYEVIVVENESTRLLGAQAAESSGPNVRHFLRHESASSPVFAANFGAAQARGRVLAMMVDGARLLSPGVIELALLAHRAERCALVSVPGYHLGSELQQRAVQTGYGESAEAGLLSSIGWPDDGYRLFDISCLSGSCAGGFLVPYAESNCLCLTKEAFERLRGFDERFVSRGGGYTNLDFYVRATELPDVALFVTPGEGTFHQFHGGITTGGVGIEDRARLMNDIHDEYQALRGHPFVMPQREAILLGRIPPNARRFFEESMKNWERRAAR